jgi:hypothetical protein
LDAGSRPPQDVPTVDATDRDSHDEATGRAILLLAQENKYIVTKHKEVNRVPGSLT